MLDILDGETFDSDMSSFFLSEGLTLTFPVSKLKYKSMINVSEVLQTQLKKHTTQTLDLD